MDERLQPPKCGFSMISVPPTRRNEIESQIVSSIKSLHETFWNSWNGILIEGTGKAGHSLQEPSTKLTPKLAHYFDTSAALLSELSSSEDLRPPVLKFSASKDLKSIEFAMQQFSFKLFRCEIRLVKNILENSGGKQTEREEWNLLWIGMAPQPSLYERLNPYQRVNHFPNSYEITRKDKLCYAIRRMAKLYSEDEFGFMPKSFVLPDEFSEFYTLFHKEKKSFWIVKPTSSSQGKGIYLIDSMGEIPIEEYCIISQYIPNPLLINGLKFDLRLYVLVTCYEPLRIYLFEEGLVRFASEPYKPGNKNNRFMHLTNYSLNKKSENFVQNEDFRVDNSGHKWSLSALCKLFEQHGISTDVMWSKIYDLVIKTVLSNENSVVETLRKVGLNRNNCFDLLGFDVLIDENLKPWLLEVNLCPSMATDAPLDFHIKSNLLTDLFNLLGLRIPKREREWTSRQPKILGVKKQKLPVASRSQSPAKIRTRDELKAIERYREYVKETLEEQNRRGRFIRIYPALGTVYYDKYFESPRPYNTYLYNMLYVDLFQSQSTLGDPVEVDYERVTRRLNVKHTPPRKMPLPSIEGSIQEKKRCKSCGSLLRTGNSEYCISCRIKHTRNEEKIVITGDDILMEYLKRLIEALKKIEGGLVKKEWKRAIEKFLTHYVWMKDLEKSSSLAEKLQGRLSEMTDRKKKFLSEVRRKNPGWDRKKGVLISGFSASELEDMMKSSTRNVAFEVFSCFLSEEGVGILSEVNKVLENNSKNIFSFPTEIDSPGFEEEEVCQNVKNLKKKTKVDV